RLRAGGEDDARRRGLPRRRRVRGARRRRERLEPRPPSRRPRRRPAHRGAQAAIRRRPQLGWRAAPTHLAPASGRSSAALTRWAARGRVLGRADRSLSALPASLPRTRPSRHVGELCPLAGATGTLPPVPATVIVGAQWGDEGKGKIVDLLARD